MFNYTNYCFISMLNKSYLNGANIKVIAITKYETFLLKIQLCVTAILIPHFT